MQPTTEDLCPGAVKVARRLQNLTKGRLYSIILIKDKHGKWSLAILSEAKLETVQS